MPDLTYDVVAVQFPIVYSNDGDHDPDGLLYTLRAYLPLLDWARARWDDDDRFLLRMHERADHLQLIVDGLDRYERMRERLSPGDPLLSYGMDAGELTGEHDNSGLEPRRHTITQNLRATVDELVEALRLVTDGAITALAPDPATRVRWAAGFSDGLAATRTAIAERLAKLEVDDHTELRRLARESGLDLARVRRLLLNDHRTDVRGLGERTPAFDRFNPLRPVPVVRPLVLRAALGARVDVRFANQIRDRRVGLHLQGDGIGSVRTGDGAAVGRNEPTTVRPGQRRTYHWHAGREGVWVINDLGDVRGTERGTNMHGLFGAFVVEPAGATWHDPETGEPLTGTAYADGPYADIILPGDRPDLDFVDFHLDGLPHSHREFTVFMHDEPEVHSGRHLVGEHSIMPLSYRAEAMPNRLPHRMRRYAEATAARSLPPPGELDPAAVAIEIDDELSEVFHIGRDHTGRFLELVSGEEQHHSSWLFGDPVTPIFRAYKGDPARVRLVHAGVKETHVFHLHVHQWRAVPQDTAQPSVFRPGEPRGSQLIDSITIGPQTALTVDPLYGSGSRQRAPGDIIWHCHLYPHFHHGMWGLWRSFDRLVDGSVTAYPDGTPVHPLQPLPGRVPEQPSAERPGFPWFIDAAFPQKAPPPPAVVPEFLSGRRRLLGLPLHSATERAAFPPGVLADPRPGAVFVDLDGDARAWNETAGLPAPRIISYEVEVDAAEVAYNSRGWRDLRGHHYRLTKVTVTDDGTPVEFIPPEHDIEPFFPRANHGDIVEWRMVNKLRRAGPDGFDLPILPVECGLHVHLVKFDVLAADGSSTGFNYLSGASSPDAVGDEPSATVGFHRWVVDEEFGPCFFHDHLLANYRQKHGLFAALIAEPHGSRWLLPDQETVAWSGPQAVVLPPVDSGLPPYREACLAVGDFVPLVDADGSPLNPPGELSGDDDPGSMAVNYRSAPLTFRGDDPSQWFSSNGGTVVEEPEDPEEPVAEGAGGDPDTEIIRTYPGDRLRIRLIQGSHEEQHSFVTHGLRWRREWHNDRSLLVNQQTIGISEAFTLDIDPADAGAYSYGDHLWHFAAMDDLWLGCWGLIRALTPSAAHLEELPPLPGAATAGDTALPPRPAVAWGAGGDRVREFVVTARRHEHEYDGRRLTDPWGLIYATAPGWRDEPVEEGSERLRRRAVGVHDTGEPLVLRARPGEWVRVMLINELLPDPAGPVLPPFGVEPSPPRLPLEKRVDELGDPLERTVSPRVSLHPSLLRYDVVSDDGANVGTNHDGTVGPLPAHAGGHGGPAEAGRVVFRDPASHGHEQRNWREYWWYVDEHLAPPSYADGPGQVCYLQDLADVRNHRHHGLVGALVVEPDDVVPIDPVTGRERWTGPRVLLRDERGRVVANEQVLLVQDGLRHFVAGHPDLPVRDVVPGDDPEDSGQKGINYGSAVVHPRDMLTRDDPPTPVWPARVGQELWLHVVGAADKPRNHTFTVHGMAWPAAPWQADGPWEGSFSGLTAGTARTLTMTARHSGDHAYRSGAFRWSVENGLWGIIRVE